MPRPKSSRNKIGVIGSINRDTIYRADGSTIESWGGILYNLHFLNQSGVGDIYPVANLGSDGYKSIMAILGHIKNIKTDYINQVTEPNNHCFLHYHDQSHKCEILKGGVPVLTFKRIEPLLACDAVIVNFISGRDVGLKALERFRAEYKGTIYMDIHSLTLGRRRVEGGYKRFLRRPPFWRRFAACADIVQINEAEFELLSGKPFVENTVKEFYRDLLPRCQCLIITQGRQGAAVISGKRSAKLYTVPPIAVKKVYDTTGCGDAFAAGFIADFMVSKDYFCAAESANRAAASRCRVKGKMF